LRVYIITWLSQLIISEGDADDNEEKSKSGDEEPKEKPADFKGRIYILSYQAKNEHIIDSWTN
jgi:hypothetical protein